MNYKWPTFAIVLGISACTPTGLMSQPGHSAQPTPSDRASVAAQPEPTQKSEAENTPPAEDVASNPNSLIQSVEVYDGRNPDLPNSTSPKVTQATIEKAFQEDQAKIQKNTSFDCEKSSEGITIVGNADGAFTRPNASQKMVLYEQCRPGRTFGLGGMVVLEGTTVKAHYIYGENGLMSGLKTTPDVNQNGLTEVVLIGGSTNQGYTGQGINLFELNGGTLSHLGGTSTYTDNSGAVQDRSQVKTRAYKISAQPGSNPTFLKDTYEKKDGSQAWSLIQEAEPLSLFLTDPGKFVKVR